MSDVVQDWRATRYDELTEVERFWMKVDKRSSNECWTWIAAKNEHGYGLLGVTRHGRKFNMKAHRLSYEIEHGIELASEQFVLHSCDNPPCVNPAHLRLGDQFDNMRDAKERDRHKRGERGATKLTDAKVVAIRRRVAKGQPHEIVASEFGISQAMVSTIATGKQWSHIGGPRTSSINKTHCVNGHSLEGSNLIPRKGAKGRCRICTRASQRKYKQKMKEAA